MRTTTDLNEKLVSEVMKLAGVTTKREAVDVALRRFVQSGNQRRLLELKGTGGLAKHYDYKRARRTFAGDS